MRTPWRRVRRKQQVTSESRHAPRCGAQFSCGLDAAVPNNKSIHNEGFTMQHHHCLRHVPATLIALAAASTTALAGTTVQIGNSGKTFASAAAQCAVHPVTGVNTPMVQAGLFNPTPRAEADVRLNGVKLQEVKATAPVVDVWLADGNNTVSVALSRKVSDSYAFAVAPGQCTLPSIPGNFFSPDGTLEYAASGKSYLTVAPGCALNPATGLTQPFVNLFDNGSFLLNVSVNGIPLTQLSATRPRAVVCLAAGRNLITAVNGGLSTDSYLREGGSGTCVLP